MGMRLESRAPPRFGRDFRFKVIYEVTPRPDLS